jgi:hypothetical protein
MHKFFGTSIYLSIYLYIYIYIYILTKLYIRYALLQVSIDQHHLQSVLLSFCFAEVTKNSKVTNSKKSVDQNVIVTVGGKIQCVESYELSSVVIRVQGSCWFGGCM